jgi:hypothetical protein
MTSIRKNRAGQFRHLKIVQFEGNCSQKVKQRSICFKSFEYFYSSETKFELLKMFA